MEKFDCTCDSDDKYILLNYPPLSRQPYFFFQVDHSATRDKEAETHQDPGNNKKKRKPRRRKFNWFSDLYWVSSIKQSG